MWSETNTNGTDFQIIYFAEAYLGLSKTCKKIFRTFRLKIKHRLTSVDVVLALLSFIIFITVIYCFCWRFNLVFALYSCNTQKQSITIVLMKGLYWEMSQNSQEKTCAVVSVKQSCRPAACKFIKKKILRHICIPLNFM